MEQLNKPFLRLNEIIGQQAVTNEEAHANRQTGKGPRKARPEIQALLPISASCWWSGIKAGRFPKPVKLAPRVTVWKSEDIKTLLNQ